MPYQATFAPFRIEAWSEQGGQVPTPASLQVIHRYWAAYLGCHQAQLSRPGTAVVRNGPGLADYHGATAFYRPPACVLAVPAD